MPLKTFTKDPDERLNYSIDWSAWLDSGDTLSSSSWTIPVGITKDSASRTGTVATVQLSGGTAGTIYNLTNTIITTTAPTQIAERLIAVRVENRT